MKSKAVSQRDTNQAVPDSKTPPFASDEQSKQSMKALDNLVGEITPTLIEIGSWVFGGLLAFSVVVIASLLTVGPVDVAVVVSTTMLACALPFNVAGIFLLRLIKDMSDIGIENLTLQAFRNADFPDIEAYFPAAHERETVPKRRAKIALIYSAVFATLSIALSVTGFAAALWHMEWWIGVIFAVVVVLSIFLGMVVLGHSAVPISEAEKELKRRYLMQRKHGPK